MNGPLSTSYAIGYRNGHLDSFLGFPPLRVAMAAPMAGYASGYYDGYHNLTFKEVGKWKT